MRLDPAWAALFAKENPKRPGSSSAERYEVYKRAKTVGEALRLGATPGDLQHDFRRGYARRLDRAEVAGVAPKDLRSSNDPSSSPRDRELDADAGTSAQAAFAARGASRPGSVGGAAGATEGKEQKGISSGGRCRARGAMPTPRRSSAASCCSPPSRRPKRLSDAKSAPKQLEPRIKSRAGMQQPLAGEARAGHGSPGKPAGKRVHCSIVEDVHPAAGAAPRGAAAAVVATDACRPSPAKRPRHQELPEAEVVTSRPPPLSASKQRLSHQGLSCLKAPAARRPWRLRSPAPVADEPEACTHELCAREPGKADAREAQSEKRGVEVFSSLSPAGDGLAEMPGDCAAAADASAPPLQVMNSPTPMGRRRVSQGRTAEIVSPSQESSVLLCASGPSQAGAKRKSRGFRLSLHKLRRPMQQDPAFAASEVAALIGMHRHCPALHALVRCWQKNHKASLRAWERNTGGVALPEVTFARHASTPVHAAVAAAAREGDGALRPEAEARICEAVKKSGAPKELVRSIAEEALGRARRARGTRLEHTGLDAYELASKRKVERRNIDGLRRSFQFGSGSFVLRGRADGFEAIGSERWVVEHKRRQRRLFEEVPRYEEIQCQIYMAISGCGACRWVQTMGSEVDARVLPWCPRRWACIEGRLKGMARLLRRLFAGALCPAPNELEDIQRKSWDRAPLWPEGPAALKKRFLASAAMVAAAAAAADEAHALPEAPATPPANAAATNSGRLFPVPLPGTRATTPIAAAATEAAASATAGGAEVTAVPALPPAPAPSQFASADAAQAHADKPARIQSEQPPACSRLRPAWNLVPAMQHGERQPIDICSTGPDELMASPGIARGATPQRQQHGEQLMHATAFLEPTMIDVTPALLTRPSTSRCAAGDTAFASEGPALPATRLEEDIGGGEVHRVAGLRVEHLDVQEREAAATQPDADGGETEAEDTLCDSSSSRSEDDEEQKEGVFGGGRRAPECSAPCTVLDDESATGQQGGPLRATLLDLSLTLSLQA